MPVAGVGDSTLQELRHLLRLLVDRPVNDLTDREADRWLRWAMHSIYEEVGFNITEDVIAGGTGIGTRRYTLGTDVGDVLQVRVDEVILERTSRADLNRLSSGWESADNQISNRWFTEGRFLHLDPAPITAALVIDLVYRGTGTSIGTVSTAPVGMDQTLQALMPVKAALRYAASPPGRDLDRDILRSDWDSGIRAVRRRINPPVGRLRVTGLGDRGRLARR